MRIGIHQPNFLPWLGYFYKISQCDTFVFLDHVEFTKKSYTKRVLIHKPENVEERQYLTVPLHKHSDHATINTLEIATKDRRLRKSFAQVRETYKHAPYFHQLEAVMSKLSDEIQSNAMFATVNETMIKHIAGLLHLHPDWMLSSQLNVSYSGQDVNLDIVLAQQVSTYISGLGAKKYQDEKLYMQHRVHLVYADFPAHFSNLDIPAHFFDKSIIAYLAHYPLEKIQEFLAAKQ